MKNNDSTLELKILGALLQSPSLFAQISHLSSEAFYDSTHASVFQCIELAVEKGINISPSSLAMNFDDRLQPLGGMKLVDQIGGHGGDIIPTFSTAVERLRELYQWRLISDISRRLATAVDAKEKSPDEILSGISRVTEDLITNGNDTSRTKHAVARSAIERAKEAKDTVTTGIDTLDFMMQGGLQSRRLYGIGGLYGRGKTILLGSISHNLNLQRQPHLFITMETEPEDIELRSYAAAINQNASVLYDQFDPEHEAAIEAVEAQIPQVPDMTYYEYAPGASINEIHRMILRAKSRYGIRGFILDYWQLIRGRAKGVSEDQHYADCADRIAAICRQQDLWGIMTAQVDDKGRLKKSESLLQSAALYVRLVRDVDEQAAFFATEKSNYTRYADTGTETTPGMIFDMASGPHFRNTEDMDLPVLTAEMSGKIEI